MFILSPLRPDPYFLLGDTPPWSLVTLDLS
jgi:hypothetical protein